jgi:biopolymer transport protein ExbD
MSKYKNEKVEVPLSAMIDITFLLLSYFIVTQSTPIEEAFIALNKPSIRPNPPSDIPPPTLDIYLQSDRYLVMNRSYTSIKDLKPFIDQYSENAPNSTVNLKLSGHARTQKFVDLLDLLAATKMQKHINIAYLKDKISE